MKVLPPSGSQSSAGSVKGEEPSLHSAEQDAKAESGGPWMRDFSNLQNEVQQIKSMLENSMLHQSQQSPVWPKTYEYTPSRLLMSSA